MRPLVRRVSLGIAVLGLVGCGYVRLLRPSVLKQLNPNVVRLVNELPATDDVNEALIGRLFAHGGAADVTVGRDGVMRVDVRVPRDEYLWKPTVIIMPRAVNSRSTFPTTTASSTWRFFREMAGARSSTSRSGSVVAPESASTSRATTSSAAPS